MNKIKFNFMYSIIYQILLILVPLITTPYLSRIIGSQGLGIYAYSYSIVNYFCLFSLLGNNNYGNRKIAMVSEDIDKRSKFFIEIYSIQLVSSLIALLVYILYIVFFPINDKGIASLQIILIVSAALDINWFFFGVEKFKLTVSRNIIVKIISVIGIFVFVKNSEDLWKYTLLIAISDFISHVSLWPFLLKEVKFTKFNFNNSIKHAKPTLVLSIPLLANSINRNLDKVLLGSLSTMSITGIYSNADKIVNMPMGIITALGTVMLPRMTNMYANNKPDTALLYIKQSMLISNFLACGLSFGLAAIANELAPVFLGNEFKDSSPIIILLSITVFFIGWSNVIRTQYIIPKGKDSIYIEAVAIGAVLNIVLNILLISRFNAIGASIATVSAEFVSMLVQNYRVRKDLPIIEYIRDCIPFIASGILMFIGVRIIASIITISAWGIIIEISIGALIYFSLSLIFSYIFNKKMVLNLLKLLIKK